MKRLLSKLNYFFWTDMRNLLTTLHGAKVATLTGLALTIVAGAQHPPPARLRSTQ